MHAQKCNIIVSTHSYLAGKVNNNNMCSLYTADNEGVRKIYKSELNRSLADVVAYFPPFPKIYLHNLITAITFMHVHHLQSCTVRSCSSTGLIVL